MRPAKELAIAAKDGSITKVKVLLRKDPALAKLMKHAVDLNCTKGTEHHGGQSPLGALLGMRRYGGARWLLEHGADPNIRCGADGQTALHEASKAGCKPEAIQLLLDHGAEINAKDAKGRTPRKLARLHRWVKVAQFLRAHGGRE